MKQYRLIARNDLLFTRAALKQQNRTRVVSLLLDSGATYTILSWEVLLSLRDATFHSSSPPEPLNDSMPLADR